MDQVSVTQTSIKGLWRIVTPIFEDNRGTFTKIFNKELFSSYQLSTDFKEGYYSFSKKGVIRGMHFQLPPHDHAKLVHVPQGEIMDVVLDIRKGSETFGKFETFTLSRENGTSLYLEPGLAHGFEALSDDVCVSYLQTTTHSPHHDRGIRFDSFGVVWNTSAPIISQRDSSFPGLSQFESPFELQQ